MILTYVFACLFVAGLILSAYLYIILKKTKSVVEVLKNSINVLKNSIEVELIKLNHREGFYDGSFNLVSAKDEHHTYNYRLYVYEMEKYKNGYSKLKILKIDIVRGFDNKQYEYIKKLATENFLEIQETKNITFLDRDIDITQLRKDKLERILKEE